MLVAKVRDTAYSITGVTTLSVTGVGLVGAGGGVRGAGVVGGGAFAVFDAVDSASKAVLAPVLKRVRRGQVWYSWALVQQ